MCKGVSQLKLATGTINGKAYSDNNINDIKLQNECTMSQNIHQDNVTCQISAKHSRVLGTRVEIYLIGHLTVQIWSIVKSRIRRIPNIKDRHLENEFR